MEEQTEDLARRLVRHFGIGVSVEYVDVFSKRMEDFPSVQKVVNRGNVPLPVIGFNGEPRIAGGISIDMIIGVLDKMGMRPWNRRPNDGSARP
jgi:hypothetical protein